jgi:hypothetical protein
MKFPTKTDVEDQYLLDATVVRHTQKATLFLSQGTHYWVPKSAYSYDEDSLTVTVPSWVELREASSSPAAPSRPSSTSSPSSSCPHCGASLILLPAWEAKNRPAKGIRGACKGCGGLFTAVPLTPVTQFTVTKYIPEYIQPAVEEDLTNIEEDPDIPF